MTHCETGVPGGRVFFTGSSVDFDFIYEITGLFVPIFPAHLSPFALIFLVLKVYIEKRSLLNRNYIFRKRQRSSVLCCSHTDLGVHR